MKTTTLALALFTLSALPLAAGHDCSMMQRGDAVMGFSHMSTAHHFPSLDDGGAIEVRANDAKDAKSIEMIRTHLQSIAKEFAKGDFAKPKEIHGRVPDGAATMKELRAKITYTYEELEDGGRVRIRTSDAKALEAIHAFLKFQRDEHGTD